jgi:acetylglutamate kinase
MSKGQEGVKPIVIKIGGSTLGNHDTTLEDLVALQKKGVPCVVVHGGGKIISDWMKKQGIPPRFVRGLRVTDEPSLEIAAAVLTGLINKQLVSALLAKGARVMGMSGVDGGILEGVIEDPELGLVGKIIKVNPDPIFAALNAGYIPLLAPIGVHQFDGSEHSGSLLNINGDTAAGEIAWALRASHLVFLTDVEGVKDASGRVMPRLSESEARRFLRSGVASGGMIPKLEAGLRAMETVQTTQIVDGRLPGALMDCLSNKAVGTYLVRTRFPERGG